MPNPDPQRGEIWLVDFDPSKDDEIRKTRPALVVSVSSVGVLQLRIVVPITEWKPRYASAVWFVHLSPDKTNGLQKPSAADAFQVKSVALARFRSRLGFVTASQLDDVASAISVCVGAP